ncbi:MAG: secretin N-terminal domain-containing protein [Acidobacteriota bacterium]
MFEARSRAVLRLVLIGLLLSTSAALAKPSPAPLSVYAFSFEHQSASDAIFFVRHLLSPRGTVELQPGGNTLVVRDERVAINKIRRMLEGFDHPPRMMRIDIHVLRAGTKIGTEGEVPPEALVDRLRGLLRYDEYRQIAVAELSSREGEDVTYALGRDYRVSFKLGTLLGDRRLRLDDFRITATPGPRSANKSRRPEPHELIHTDLNLWKNQQFALVLSQEGTTPEAVLVAISFRLEDEPTR